MYKQYQKVVQERLNNQNSSCNKQKRKKKPEWDYSLVDQDKYKLTPAEQIQKKASFISKNRFQAHDQWVIRQQKLQQGIIDEETNKIFETAKLSKNLLKKDDITRKNLSQLLTYNDDFLQSNLKAKVTEEEKYLYSLKQSCSQSDLQESNGIVTVDQKNEQDFMQAIQGQIQKTKKFIEQMEVCSCKEVYPQTVIKVQEKLNRQEEKPNMKSSQSSSQKINFKKEKISNGKEGCKKNCQPDHKSLENENFDKENQNSVNYEQKDTQQNQMGPVYFSSLNKIEDTIKFMEENILGKHGPQCSEVEVTKVPLKSKLPKLLPNKSNMLDPEKKILTESLAQTNKPTNYEVPINPDKDLNPNDAVSFSLTARSTENSPIKQCQSFNEQNKVLLANKDNINNVDSKELSNPNDLNDSQDQNVNNKINCSGACLQNKHSDNFERDGQGDVNRLPEREDIQELGNYLPSRFSQESLTTFQEIPKAKIVQMAMVNDCMPNCEQKQKQFEKKHEENDEGIMDLENIRQMLENTRKDLEKMNQVNFEFPHLTVNKINFSGSSREQTDVDFEALKREQIGLNKIGNSQDFQSYSSSTMKQFSTRLNDKSKDNNIPTTTDNPVIDESEVPVPKSLTITQYQSSMKDTIDSFMQKQKDNYKNESLNIRVHSNL